MAVELRAEAGTSAAAVPAQEFLHVSTEIAKRRFSARKDERGRFMPRHYNGVDSNLVGKKAFDHPAVHRWWKWLIRDYSPPYSIALLTPCSNIKPYTRSPTSRKVRAVLRRLNAWEDGKPKKVTWMYFSDLLIFVPYERAEEYPACCYEVHPDVVLRDKSLTELVVNITARVLTALSRRGLEVVVTFLPSKHAKLWEQALAHAETVPEIIKTRYTLFSVFELEETLKTILNN
ncbi:MAG: DUF5591 domain-containing protein [Thermoproteota archaeon]